MTKSDRDKLLSLDKRKREGQLPIARRYSGWAWAAVLAMLLAIATLASPTQGQNPDGTYQYNVLGGVTKTYTAASQIYAGQIVVRAFPASTVKPIPHGSTSGVLGVALSTAPAGGLVTVGITGVFSVSVDGSCTQAYSVGVSPTVDGNGTCINGFSAGPIVGLALDTTTTGTTKVTISPTTSAATGPGSGSFTAAGDLSGTGSSQTVVGLRGANIPTPVATTGSLYDTNGTLSWAANVPTATALAAAPSQCSGGQIATGVAANGNANCTTAPGGGNVTNNSSNFTQGLPLSSSNSTTGAASSALYYDASQFSGTNSGLNTCLSNADSAQNMCDARAKTGALTLTAPLIVGDSGNSSGSVLYLPSRCVFAGDGLPNNSGVGAILFQYGGTVVKSDNAGGASQCLFTLTTANPTPAYMYSNNTGNGKYEKLEGVKFRNGSTGTTLSSGIDVFWDWTDDGSTTVDLSVLDTSGTPYLFENYASCCGTSHYDLNLNASNVSGSVPLYVKGGSSHNTGINFYSLSADHAGSASPDILMDDPNHQSLVNSFGPYEESNGTTPQSVAYNSISGMQTVNIFGGIIDPIVASSTAGGYTVDNTFATGLSIFGASFVNNGNMTFPGTMVTNSKTGNSAATDASGNLGLYTSAPSYFDAPVTEFSYQDMLEIAAPSNPPSGRERWYANSSTHTFNCLTSSGSSCAPSGTGLPTLPTTPNGVAQTVTSTPSGGVGGAATWSVPGVTIDAQTGASPSVAQTDVVELFKTSNNTTSTAVAVPSAATLSSGFAFAHCNTGSVVATDTPATSTINGNSTLKLLGQVAGNNPECAFWWSDNTNYLAAEILPTDVNGRLQASGFPALTGDITTSAGAVATTLATVNSNVGTFANPSSVTANAKGLVTAIAAGIANTTFTNATTAIGANACSASAVTVTLTGVATTSVLLITPSTDVSGSTGWGSSGGLVIDAWPSATNTMSYKICNQTGSSITPAAVTWNVGAR